MAEVDGNKRASGDWRTVLRQHALHILQHDESQHDVDCARTEALLADLGPLAEDAVAMVEAFARGMRFTRGAAINGEAPAGFSARLEILFAGLERERSQRRDALDQASEAPPHVIQSELWQMLRRTRESAELSYAREFDLIELDRRILFMLHNQGPLVPADVSNAVGVDKAQVSRSVKRLLEHGMLEREQIRAPLRLTQKGETLGRRLMRLAELRNRELTFDVTDDELTEFFSTIEVLLDRAVALYEKERMLAHPSGRGASDSDEDTTQTERIVIDRTRIISPLMTLSAYFSRSGALAFKRLTGMSNFEAFVLSEIGMNPPIDWTSLVKGIERDHSQAGRTINALIDRGLVRREGRPGRRHGRFSPSEEGARLHKIIHDEGAERSAFLLAPLSDDQRRRFLAIFEKISRNAVAQLERERAFAELDG